MDMDQKPNRRLINPFIAIPLAGAVCWGLVLLAVWLVKPAFFFLPMYWEPDWYAVDKGELKLGESLGVQTIDGGKYYRDYYYFTGSKDQKLILSVVNYSNEREISA